MSYENDISGIYIIFNLKSGKCYIGSAVFINHRFASHKYQLRHNKHFNKHLQWSWNKDGEESFIFEVVEIVPKELLQEKEEYYIQVFQSNKNKFGYNRRIDCGTNLGVTASEETKLKMRLSKLGIPRTEEAKININKAKFKGVYQIDSNTLKIINKFPSIKDAVEKTGLCSRGISLCTTKKMITHPKNKFHWCFVKNFEEFKTYIEDKIKNKGKWKKRKN